MVNEQEYITLSTETPEIKVWLKESPKAKHGSIKITRQGEVELVIPYKTDKAPAYKFLLSKEKWIRKKLSEQAKFFEERESALKKIVIHDAYPILSETYSITHIEDRRKLHALIVGASIVVHSPEGSLHIVLTHFFKNLAYDKFNAQVRILAKKYGLDYNKVDVKELKSKWGSCSSKKNLTFNWRLIFAPKNVFFYLVVHELCHLKEMNHSSRFWDLVCKIDPNYKIAQKWIKDNGQSLYNFLPLSDEKHYA
ncbi:M48 family metallopeptidase [Candidatus Bandiella numerosa]|uniref:M48 family metallopeptidase n=1 Tax=Candidatus Bandiella numerosa TaxID=2570586 RepID=UPI001F31518B|nr:SprT family zinc-dependent metalloprotease [Candidatus Bandiella numerosa]